MLFPSKPALYAGELVWIRPTDPCTTAVRAGLMQYAPHAGSVREPQTEANMHCTQCAALVQGIRFLCQTVPVMSLTPLEERLCW